MRSLSLIVSQAEYNALIALLSSSPDWDISLSLLPKLIDAWTIANPSDKPAKGEDLVTALTP